MFPHDHSKCKSADLRLNIFTAAQWGDLHSLIHSVEQRGVDPSKCDDYGLTPLHHAATKGHLLIVQYLLSRHANPNARACGASPLHRACYHGHLSIVQALVDAGADLNAQDESTDGRTPLAKASAQGHLPVVQYLLHAGEAAAGGSNASSSSLERSTAGAMTTSSINSDHRIDLSIRDRRGKTALEVAVNDSIRDVLIQADFSASPLNIQQSDSSCSAADSASTATNLSASHIHQFDIMAASCTEPSESKNIHDNI